MVNLVMVRYIDYCSLLLGICKNTNNFYKRKGFRKKFTI